MSSSLRLFTDPNTKQPWKFAIGDIEEPVRVYGLLNPEEVKNPRKAYIKFIQKHGGIAYKLPTPTRSSLSSLDYIILDETSSTFSHTYKSIINPDGNKINAYFDASKIISQAYLQTFFSFRNSTHPTQNLKRLKSLDPADFVVQPDRLDGSPRKKNKPRDSNPFHLNRDAEIVARCITQQYIYAWDRRHRNGGKSVPLYLSSGHRIWDIIAKRAPTILSNLYGEKRPIVHPATAWRSFYRNHGILIESIRKEQHDNEDWYSHRNSEEPVPSWNKLEKFVNRVGGRKRVNKLKNVDTFQERGEIPGQITDGQSEDDGISIGLPSSEEDQDQRNREEEHEEQEGEEGEGISATYGTGRQRRRRARR